jgi:hypothetical protein
MGSCLVCLLSFTNFVSLVYSEATCCMVFGVDA